MNKKSFVGLLARICIAVWFFTLPASAQTAKNAVWVIGDGMGSGTMGMFMQGVKLAHLEQYPDKTSTLEKFINASQTGLFFSHTYDSIVTDSACAATQMACGVKSTPGAIGVDATGKKVVSILEEAVKAGKAVGVITDSYVADATPAGFLAHVANRGEKYSIAQQIVYSQAQVVLGGGLKYFSAGPNHDLLSKAREQGWQVVKTLPEMQKVTKGRILGLFAHEALPFYGEKEDHSHVPTLKEMTQKAVELLSQNEKGFVLIVEAGKIDWALHDNEAGPTLWEMISLDETLAYVWNFAQEKKDTLVYVNADHETGVPAFHYYNVFGEQAAQKTAQGERLYHGNMDYVNYPYYDKLFKHKRMLYFMYPKFKALPKEEQTPEKLQKMTQEVLGENLDLQLGAWIPHYEGLIEKVNRAYGLVWATKNHSGAMLLGVAYGPGSSYFGGVYHNTDLKEKFKKALNM